MAGRRAGEPGSCRAALCGQRPAAGGLAVVSPAASAFAQPAAASYDYLFLDLSGPRPAFVESDTAVILNETRVYPGTTVSLISCTQPNQLPTNLRYRLITTAVLVAVTEDGIPVA